MLIPKQVLNASKIASSDSTRYAINGAELQRDGDECTIAATDGRMMIETRWTEADKPERVVQDYSNIISRRGLADVMKAHKPTKGQGDHPIILDEPISGNGSATFETIGRDGKAVLSCQTVEGNFPDYKSVIPEYKPAEAVTYTLDAGLLSTLVTAIADSVANIERNVVTLTIPARETGPMRIDATNGVVSSVGVIMPCKAGNPDNKALQAASELAPAMNGISSIVSGITDTSTEYDMRHALARIGEMADKINPDTE